jgi:septal ring factor EnvC (AmiA/AmiB activator)
MSDIAQIWQQLKVLHQKNARLEDELAKLSPSFARARAAELSARNARPKPTTEAEAARLRIIDEIEKTGRAPDWARPGSESNYLKFASAPAASFPDPGPGDDA